ncbi:hypothetical protein [Bacillus pumilus]|jgi:hypothetical protein|uniref:hypothetical protein n=1 Tax=Bacillus pumilus TaxID=1408 RepID=UPI00081FC8D5|nr:hypothetical protein [Bacillus pumilus]AOC55295.1 hypothetical protein BEN31_00075 [Bacillus pumilus]MBR0588679.1 hypothetical protein [Bacillus pumilus DW2J2]MBR0618647.1 hypothetical protein [Bacillus pumilus]MBR0624715.1 hypothetical protein [Bacillus pumilus]MCY7724072.1 hypothetical protein [Bacillus pumilus]
MKSVVKAKVIEGWGGNHFNDLLQDFIDECNAEGLAVDIKYPHMLTNEGPVLAVAYKEMR